MLASSGPVCCLRRWRQGAGFTLLEMLVVLVIVALISGVLFTAFERMLDIRLRLAAFLEGVDVPTLVGGWFRDSVEGLVPDVNGGADQFAGSPRQLTGLSLMPIDGTAGVPTRITWELDYQAGDDRTYLQYRAEDAAPRAIASWPGDLGGFYYCAPSLACYRSWPPAPGAAELPALIRLDAVRGAKFWPILAAPQADGTPLPRLRNPALPP
jgi:prepilin-type N-terminal cleavage/methylation domain-containing protein